MIPEWKHEPRMRCPMCQGMGRHYWRQWADGKFREGHVRCYCATAEGPRPSIEDLKAMKNKFRINLGDDT